MDLAVYMYLRLEVSPEDDINAVKARVKDWVWSTDNISIFGWIYGIILSTYVQNSKVN